MTHLAGMTALARLMERCPPVMKQAGNFTPRRYSDGIVCTSCREEKRPHDYYLKTNGEHEAMCKRCRSARALARHHAKKAANG